MLGGVGTGAGNRLRLPDFCHSCGKWLATRTRVRHPYHTKPLEITQQRTARYHPRTTLPEEITFTEVKTIQWHHHASTGYRSLTPARSIRVVAPAAAERNHGPSNVASMGVPGSTGVVKMRRTRQNHRRQNHEEGCQGQGSPDISTEQHSTEQGPPDRTLRITRPRVDLAGRTTLGSGVNGNRLACIRWVRLAWRLVPYPETSCKKARNLMATPGSRGQMSDVRGQ